MTSNTDATKYYSNKQERMIARSLCWYCVTGSGATACRPGDIYNDTWLGECKTHVTLQNQIKFYWDHWSKINLEATSKLRQPALFVDDGSQQYSSTYVLCHPLAYMNKFMLGNASFRSGKTSLSIRVKDIESAYGVAKTLRQSKPELSDKCIAFSVKFHGISMIVVPLEEFKSAFGDYVC